MLKIKKDTIPAADMAFEQLFTDTDGDLYYRCYEGAVMFDGVNEDRTELCAYSDSELVDYEKYPFLRECAPVEGTVKIKIKFKTSQKES
jgi:hypothetical protein